MTYKTRVIPDRDAAERFVLDLISLGATAVVAEPIRRPS